MVVKFVGGLLSIEVEPGVDPGVGVTFGNVAVGDGDGVAVGDGLFASGVRVGVGELFAFVTAALFPDELK